MHVHRTPPQSPLERLKRIGLRLLPVLPFIILSMAVVVAALHLMQNG